MKKKHASSSVQITDQCKHDFVRIHILLHDTIEYIERRSNEALKHGSDEDVEQTLDQLIGMLTKIIALLGKLIPIEKEMETMQQSASQESAEIDWEILDYFMQKRKQSSPTD